MRPRTRLTLRLGLLAAALLATACQRAAVGPAPTGVAPASAAAAATAPKRQLVPPKWKAFPRRSLLQAEPTRWPMSTFAGPTSADLQCWTDPEYCFLPGGLDDGQGRQARFRQINGMVTDAAGNAYIVDPGTFQVRKVAPDGTVTTLAGGYDGTGGPLVDGPGYDARFALPWGIASGPDGNLYVTDRNAERIRKVSPITGEVTTVGGLIGSAELIAIDGAGNTYISTSSGIRKRSLTGAHLDHISFRGDLPPQDGQLYSPGVLNGPLTAMVADAAGNLYIASENQGAIRKVTPDLVVTTIAGATEQGYQDGPAAEARFSRITGLVSDGAGGLYVADAHNNVVRHLSADGMVTTVAGSGEYGYDDGAGATADLASWSQVLSIALDKCGNLLIAEPERIRQALTPTPSQPQAACIPPPGGALSLQYEAFSPDRPNSNPDDNKDTVEIRIGAEPGESWRLELMGKGEFQTGVGPATIVWNGHRPRNPAAILPDGIYSFLLERPGKPERTASVILDTKKPIIAEVVGQWQEETGGTVFSAQIEDPESNGASSGLSIEETKVEVNGFDLDEGVKLYTEAERRFTLTLTADRTLEVLRRIESSQDPALNGNKRIKFTSRDKAGNVALQRDPEPGDRAKITVRKGPGYGLAAVNAPPVFRPLLRALKINILPPAIPHPSWISIKQLSPTPRGWVKEMYAGYSPQIFDVEWDGRQFINPFLPEPEGTYRITRWNLNNFSVEDTADIMIDNSRQLQTFDGVSTADIRKHEHIVNKPQHDWDRLFPEIVLRPKPTSVAITSWYTGRIEPLLRSILTDVRNVAGDPLVDGSGLGYVTYNYRIEDVIGNQAIVEVRTNRRLQDGLLVESIGTAYVK